MVRACCGCGLGGRAGIRGLSVQEFIGAGLSAHGCRAIWTVSGPWGRLRSSAGPAAPGLSAGVLAGTLPIPEAAAASPSAADTAHTSPLWPTRQTGEPPGRPWKEMHLAPHHLQSRLSAQPYLPCVRASRKRAAQNPPVPPNLSLLCEPCRSEDPRPEDKDRQHARLSSALTVPDQHSLPAVHLSSLDSRQSPGGSSDALVASNSVSRFTQDIGSALKEIRPQGGEGP